MDELKTLMQSLAICLQKKHLKLATAESCTGGLIAAWLTELPGSSAWFERGFVTYSNLAKQEMLGVPEALLHRYGAVSEEVACAMAQGALDHSAAELAVAVTGIAGPSGGSKTKPVGTVCFAWVGQHTSVRSARLLLPGTRQQVRYSACLHALEGCLVLCES